MQILPMSKIEFPDMAAVRAFFLTTLPGEQDGRYQYRTSGMSAAPGTMILFQFDSHIVASATLVGTTKYDTQDGPYHGEFQFEDIRVFDPLKLEDIQKVWPEVQELKNAKRKLDDRLAEFDRLISPQASDLKVPQYVEVTERRIVRDTKMSARVKELHEHRCQICGYTMTLSDGRRYSEGHHIQPLKDGGPDIESNILCLCPNHHAACDLRAIRLDLAQLRTVNGHTVAQEFIDHHNAAM